MTSNIHLGFITNKQFCLLLLAWLANFNCSTVMPFFPCRWLELLPTLWTVPLHWHWQSKSLMVICFHVLLKRLVTPTRIPTVLLFAPVRQSNFFIGTFITYYMMFQLSACTLLQFVTVVTPAGIPPDTVMHFPVKCNLYLLVKALFTDNSFRGTSVIRFFVRHIAVKIKFSEVLPGMAPTMPLTVGNREAVGAFPTVLVRMVIVLMI